MTRLLIIGFDSLDGAEQASKDLSWMQRDGAIDFHDIAVAMRSSDGSVSIRQGTNMTAAGALTGGLLGGVLGSIFLSPLLGFAIGSVVGAGAGGASWSRIDYGVDDQTIKSVATQLKPDSSVLFIMLSGSETEQADALLNRLGGKIIEDASLPVPYGESS